MTEKTQPRDWSDVVDELWESAYSDLCTFRKNALAVLQEFDRQCIQTTPVCNVERKDGNKPTAELELVIGELYICDKALDFLYLTYVGENPIKDNALIFADNEGDLHEFDDHYIRAHIRKHTPKPVEHTIKFWVNIYDGKKWQMHPTEEIADCNAQDDRIACLQFERTFVQGEGL